MEKFYGQWTSQKLELFATLEGRLTCADGGGAGDQEQIGLRADVDSI